MSVRRCLAFLALPVVFALPAGGRPADGPPAEDAKVAEFFKKKGWTVAPGRPTPAGAQYRTLDIPPPAGGAKLTAADFAQIARAKTVEAVSTTSLFPPPGDADIKPLAGMPGLKALYLRTDKMTDAGLKTVAACKGLRTLHLSGLGKFTDAGLAALGDLRDLRELTIEHTGGATGRGLEPLAGNDTLEFLEVKFARSFDDTGAKAVAKLTKLWHLDVSATGMTSAGLRALVANGAPTEFRFDNKLIDDDALKLLVEKGWLYGPDRAPPRPGDRPQDRKPATAADVRFIDLADAPVTDAGVKAVLHCTNATSVSLDRTRITDKTLAELAGFRRLGSLTVSGTPVTAAGLKEVAHLPLVQLWLVDCPMTEEMAKVIGGMKRIDRLELTGAGFKAAWLPHLAGLKLRWLFVSGSRRDPKSRSDFDDAAAKAAAEMFPDLEVFTADKSAIGDAGMAALGNLPKLRELSLGDAPVTPAFRAQFKKDHPKLSVSP